MGSVVPRERGGFSGVEGLLIWHAMVTTLNRLVLHRGAGPTGALSR